MTTQERALKTYSRYREFRDKKNVTDYAVSNAVGIRQSTISDWGRGLYTPKIEKLALIADYLEVPVTEIIG